VLLTFTPAGSGSQHRSDSARVSLQTSFREVSAFAQSECHWLHTFGHLREVTPCSHFRPSSTSMTPQGQDSSSLDLWAFLGRTRRICCVYFCSLTLSPLHSEKFQRIHTPATRFWTLPFYYNLSYHGFIHWSIHWSIHTQILFFQIKIWSCKYQYTFSLYSSVFIIISFFWICNEMYKF
jgi:hypothetical protein